MSTARHLTAASFPKHTQGLCRVCAQPVPKGRRTICSKACTERMQVLCFVGLQVRRVDKRDRGVCHLCGWDMARLARIIGWALHLLEARKRPGLAFPSRRTSRWMQPIVASLGRWNWEIDHIVPVCEGGGVRPDMTIEQVLSNLRTLCPNCHASETKALTQRRKLARRESKEPNVARV